MNFHVGDLVEKGIDIEKSIQEGPLTLPGILKHICDYLLDADKRDDQRVSDGSGIRIMEIVAAENDWLPRNGKGKTKSPRTALARILRVQYKTRVSGPSEHTKDAGIM